MLKVCAILLAAGESSRMGSPKPLLDWFGAPLVQRQIEALLEAGVSSVSVVTGHRAYEVQEAISGPRVESVINPHYRQGKSTSVKAGLAAIPHDADAVLLLAVDQPRPAGFIRQVLEAHELAGAPISCPRYQGHGGHPLIFDASLVFELDRISEHNEGVREVMRNHSGQVNWVEVDTPIARLDLNTPAAYQEAREQFATELAPE